MTFKSLGIEKKKHIYDTTKHLLEQIAILYKGREAYYGEDVSKEQIFKSISSQELNRIYCLAYGVYFDLEQVVLDRMEDTPSFKKMINRAIEQDLEAHTEPYKEEYVEILCEHIEANYHLKGFAEEVLLFNYQYIVDSYMLITFLREFTGDISSVWTKHLNSVAEAFYLSCRAENRSFLCHAFSPVALKDISWLCKVTNSAEKNNARYEKCLAVIESKYGSSSKNTCEEALCFQEALGGDENLGNIRSENFKDFSMIRQLGTLIYQRFVAKAKRSTSIEDTVYWISKIGEETKEGNFN